MERLWERTTRKQVAPARSNAEFVSKLNAGLAELDETVYWLDLLTEGDIVPAARLTDLRAEADELLAIFVTCTKNARIRAK